MRILNVDFMGCLYWHYHAGDKNPAWNFLKRLREIIDQFRVDQTLLLLEGGSTYRHGLHPGYKHARRARKEAQTDAERRANDAFMEEANSFSKDLAPLFGIIPVRVRGAEADDLAGYLCNHLPSDYQILNLSGDEDWYQLLRKNVVQGSYREIQKAGDRIPPTVWLRESDFVDKFEIPVSQWIWKKCLAGDDGDSVPGFPQLGKATALRLLQKYGSIDGIEKEKDSLEVPRMKAEAKQALAENFPLVYHNYKVMNLNHAPDAELEILGKDGLSYLEFIISLLPVPTKVDVNEITELSYERGWLEIDEDWLRPFHKKL